MKNFLAFLCREVSNVGILFKDYKTNELNSADGPFRFELPDMDRTFAEELLDAKPGPLSLSSPPKIHWNVNKVKSSHGMIARRLVVGLMLEVQFL